MGLDLEADIVTSSSKRTTPALSAEDADEPVAGPASGWRRRSSDLRRFLIDTPFEVDITSRSVLCEQCSLQVCARVSSSQSEGLRPLRFEMAHESARISAGLKIELSAPCSWLGQRQRRSMPRIGTSTRLNVSTAFPPTKLGRARGFADHRLARRRRCASTLANQVAKGRIGGPFNVVRLDGPHIAQPRSPSSSAADRARHSRLRGRSHRLWRKNVDQRSIVLRPHRRDRSGCVDRCEIVSTTGSTRIERGGGLLDRPTRSILTFQQRTRAMQPMVHGPARPSSSATAATRSP